MNIKSIPWRALSVTKQELNIDVVLACGQAFRWKKDENGIWIGVLGRHVWFLKQSESSLYYKSFSSDSTISRLVSANPGDDIAEDTKVSLAKNTKSRKKRKIAHITTEPCCLEYSCPTSQVIDEQTKLSDYFRLGVDLDSLYKIWAAKDKNFNQLKAEYPGVRVLRQDPVENLFTFICSSNNNISRITGMVEKLCRNYGNKICDIDEQWYYTFPDVQSLAANGVEENLRTLGFGYRAGYIAKTAQLITEKGGTTWLHDLRKGSYATAKSSLMTLAGVGAKVADCVCLMSLDKMEALPVDTHVWKIAQTYIPSLQKNKSLTDKLYNEIAEYFRNIWGSHAGWAQAVLFAADLPQFKKGKIKPDLSDSIQKL